MALQHQSYLSSAPSYPGLVNGHYGSDNGIGGHHGSDNGIGSTSWDDHYVQRGRSRSRNGRSRGGGGGDHRSTASSRAGGAGGGSRPRSADARPQYHKIRKDENTKVGSLRCLDRMILGGGGGESASSSRSIGAGAAPPQYRQAAATAYSPSRASSGNYHRHGGSGEAHYNDNYASHQSSGRRDYNQHSLSPGRIQRSLSDEHHYHHQSGGGMVTTNELQHYESPGRRNLQNQYQSPYRQHRYQNNPDRYNLKYPLHPYSQHKFPSYHDYIRTGEDEPIVYGEIDSVTTGQSQQDLLAHHKNHELERRRKDRNIVNMPPDLLSSAENQQHQGYDDSNQGFTFREDGLQPAGSHEKPEDSHISYEKKTTTKSPQRGGWRGLMKKRMVSSSTDSSSPNKQSTRWKNIIPSLSRSRSQSPGRNTNVASKSKPKPGVESKSLSKRDSIDYDQGPIDLDEVVSTAGSTDESDNNDLAVVGPPPTQRSALITSPTGETGPAANVTPDDKSARSPIQQAFSEEHKFDPYDLSHQKEPQQDTLNMSRSFDSPVSTPYPKPASPDSRKPPSYRQFQPKSRLAKYARSKQHQHREDYSAASTYKQFDPFTQGTDPVSTVTPSPTKSRDVTGAFPTLEEQNDNAIENTPQMKKGGPTKVSPTSVLDFDHGNSSNSTPTRGSIRWSENLDQSPTRTARYVERPKSILRSGRIRPDSINPNTPSDESIPSLPSTMNNGVGATFVDTIGRSLSPIEDEESSMPFDEPPRGRLNAKTKSTQSINARSFEKNLPREYQQAYMKESSPLKADDDSGVMSDAYVEFIESVASVVVQTAARQFLARAKLRRLLQQREAEQQQALEKGMHATSRSKNELSRSSKGCSGTLQSMPQNQQHEGHSPEDLEALIFDLAAVRIQSAFRGWFARDCITVDNYCACIIQKSFRTYQCQKHYRLDMYRIVKLQTCVRRHLALEDAATRLYCIIAIQAAFRGYSARNRVQTLVHYTRHMDKAATEIQKQWRSYYCEVEFLKTYVAILLIQSVYRGWRVRSRLEKAMNPSSSGRKNAADYRLPTSFLAHTEFMRRSLSLQDAEDESSQPSAGMASRAARAEIERRRREQEGKHKALIEEERQREDARLAEAWEVEERRRRLETKAKDRVKQAVSDQGKHQDADLPTFSSKPSIAMKSEAKDGEPRKVVVEPLKSEYREKIDRSNVVMRVPSRTSPLKGDNQRSPHRIVNERERRGSGSVVAFPNVADNTDGQKQSESSRSTISTKKPSPPKEESNESHASIKKQRNSAKEEFSGASKILAGWRAREQNQGDGNRTPDRRYSGSVGKLNVKKSFFEDREQKQHAVVDMSASSPTVSDASPSAHTKSSVAPNNTEKSPSAFVNGRDKGTKVSPVRTKLPRTKSAQRRDRIMDSLGIGPSFDAKDSDNDSLPSDEEDRIEGIRTSMRNQYSPSKEKTTPRVKSEHRVVTGIDEKPSPHASYSALMASKPYSALMASKRSLTEQERLNNIHLIFNRVGLMPQLRRQAFVESKGTDIAEKARGVTEKSASFQSSPKPGVERIGSGVSEKPSWATRKKSNLLSAPTPPVLESKGSGMTKKPSWATRKSSGIDDSPKPAVQSKGSGIAKKPSWASRKFGTLQSSPTPVIESKQSDVSEDPIWSTLRSPDTQKSSTPVVDSKESEVGEDPIWSNLRSPNAQDSPTFNAESKRNDVAEDPIWANLRSPETAVVQSIDVSQTKPCDIQQPSLESASPTPANSAVNGEDPAQSASDIMKAWKARDKKLSRIRDNAF